MNVALLLTAAIAVSISTKVGLDRRPPAHSWLTASAIPLHPSRVADPMPGQNFEQIAGQIVMDRLEQINGVEPLFARRLNQSGILTYAEMAALSPAALQSTVAPDGPFNLPTEQWLAQARRLAKGVESL